MRPGEPVPQEPAGALPDAQAHYARGLALDALGRPQDALESFRRAVELQHDYVDALVNQGRICLELGRYEDGADALHLALAFDPACLGARLHLARLARKQGQLAEAEAQLRRLAADFPQCADARFELGLALQGAEAWEAALAAYRAAVELDPRHVAAHVNLGLLTLNQLGDAGAALESFERALALEPGRVEAQANRGLALQMLGRVEEAAAYYESCIAARPDVAEFRWNRALMRLALGDYAGGWPGYEVRRTREPGGFRQPFPFPEWDGSSLAQRTILLYAEQGLGDEIMFASCIPEVMAQARHCVIECHPRLESLYRRSFPAATVRGAPRDGNRGWLRSLAAIDVQCAVGSLPLRLRHRAADFPPHGGYLAADPAQVAAWRSRLAALGPGPSIGISWRGGGMRTRSALRSLPLAAWSPILASAPARFVSLQHGERREELEAVRQRHGITISAWPEAGADLDATAALIAALDIVVTIQNTAVHLAGALGRPVWVLLSYAPDWRYLDRGEHMPWYPSARLFRQSRPGGWEAVVTRVAGELALGRA